jgi:hypothetical protein
VEDTRIKTKDGEVRAISRYFVQIHLKFGLSAINQSGSVAKILIPHWAITSTDKFYIVVGLNRSI